MQGGPRNTQYLSQRLLFLSIGSFVLRAAILGPRLTRQGNSYFEILCKLKLYFSPLLYYSPGFGMILSVAE